MASVIKAGNATDGVQVTSDNTGILELKTGTGAGTTAVTIGTNQAVTFAAGTTINGITVGRGGGSVATNTAVGANALAATTGASSNNTALGSAAGSSLTSGARNTALGFNALLLNTTGSENTAVGGNALNKSTTPSNNTAVGYVALYETTTGANNTALGAQALQNNTTASNNTAVGYQAGYSFNYTQGNNTFIGYQAGYNSNPNNANAYGNVCVGYQTGFSLTTGYGNTLIGALGSGGGDPAGRALTTGINNSFIGTGAGNVVTTGSKNTILGAYTGNQGGLDIRTASNYIVLSDGDGNPRAYWDAAGNANFPRRRSGYVFANGTSAGTTGTFNVDVTGFYGQGSGSLVDMAGFYLVTFLSTTNSHQMQGVALYTNDFNGNAILLSTLGSRALGGTITFTVSGTSPRVTVTNTTGNTPTYYCQVVFLN